jgi:kinesin family member C1
MSTTRKALGSVRQSRLRAPTKVDLGGIDANDENGGAANPVKKTRRPITATTTKRKVKSVRPKTRPGTMTTTASNPTRTRTSTRRHARAPSAAVTGMTTAATSRARRPTTAHRRAASSTTSTTRGTRPTATTRGVKRKTGVARLGTKAGAESRKQSRLEAEKQQQEALAAAAAAAEAATEAAAKAAAEAAREETKVEMQVEIDALQSTVSQRDTTIQQLNDTIATTTTENSSLTNKLQMTETNLKMTQDTVASLNQTTATLNVTISGLRAELTSVKMMLEQSQADNEKYLKQIAAHEGTITDMESTIATRDATIVDMEEQARIEEMKRRQLHNTIQELKGNIRVYCRMRPVLPSDKSDNDSSASEEDIEHYSFPDDTDKRSLELVGPDSKSVDGSSVQGSTQAFEFDRVFRPHETQEHVFDEISQLVQSALDGYKVCIFAYGQTGSGKTFTMEGGDDDDLTSPQRGMIPRSVEQIFASSKALEAKGWSYECEAMILEIYNEELHDLLASKSNKKKLEIKISKTQRGKKRIVDTYVSNATTVKVSSAAEVFPLLEKAKKNRVVGATNANERSSRSHSVFQLKLTGFNSITQQQSHGVLNLVDLAGSERLKNSKATGARLKETQAINTSLSTLGNVISALASRSKHVPYRNSKLTYLLQNCFGGDSKTLMFVNLSPVAASLHESLCSLRFASKVNACEIGTARRSCKSKA